MLERELREMAHIPRWGIVRTIRQQYLAEHTVMVAMYANDIAVWLGLPKDQIGILLQMCLWHDIKDEIFSGDITGPCKRAGMDADARTKWNSALGKMATRLFGRLDRRDGSAHFYHQDVRDLLEAVLKLADMLDECCEMGIEISLGNQNATRIFADSYQRVRNAAERVIECCPVLKKDEQRQANLRDLVSKACHMARDGESRNTRFETL